jgi:DNA-binding LacI/PurR family transcriptional regulator
MARSSLFRQSRTKRQAVYARLYEAITSGQHPPGAQLASIRQLAREFGTGVLTVQQALDDLAEAGYVVSRHGSGTFVTGVHRSIGMEDVVVLCVAARGHLWADLCGMLMEGLAEHERVGMVIGTEMKDEHHQCLIQRMAHSDARSFVVQGSSDFPFEVFAYPAMQRKTIVAVVEWVSDLGWPGLHRVLHDGELGGRLVAEHLWVLGHRHVLCVDSPYNHGCFEELPPNFWAGGNAFVREWARRGGRWQAMRHGLSDGEGAVLGADLVERFRGADAPTAVFGVRDREAWLAQQTLRRELPALDGRVAVVGYGDTPWSQAGAPPFTSVSYELEQIAKAALGVLEAARAGGDAFPELIRVAPRLVVRESSVRPGGGEDRPRRRVREARAVPGKGRRSGKT